MNPSKLHTLLFVAVWAWCSTGSANPDLTKARRMFQRLTLSYSPDDGPVVQAMASHLAKGQAEAAAALATRDPRFIDDTIVPLGLRYGSATGSTSIPYNSIVALLQLLVRAGIDPMGVEKEPEADNPGDIRQWLYARFAAAIEAPPDSTVTVPPRIVRDDSHPGGQRVNEDAHFALLPQMGWSARDRLVQVRPQYDITGHRVDYAGLFTLGAIQHLYVAGTNRRPVAHVFEKMLCSQSIQDHMDTSMPDGFVRGDVDHTEPHYSTRCVGCHAGIDALSTAFAFLDSNGGIRFANNIVAKYQRNNTTYRDGYRPDLLPSIPERATWVNYFTENQNARLGWRGPTRGVNVREFGLMISNSDAFANCLARNVWQDVCRRPMSDQELKTELGPIVARGLRQSGFRLHRLYEVVAAHPACIGGF